MLSALGTIAFLLVICSGFIDALFDVGRNGFHAWWKMPDLDMECFDENGMFRTPDSEKDWS